MLNLIVCGVCGKMGKALLEEIKKEKTLRLVGAIEAPGHPSLGTKVLGVKIDSDLEKVKEKGVVVEFTTPEATLEHLEIARRRKFPCVVGTTGFGVKERKKIEQISSSIPVLLSSNMSVGVNLLYKLVEIASQILKGYDREIIEIHHRHKKDAPSGTALTLGEILAREEGKSLSSLGVFGRRGRVGERSSQEIGFHSVRGGSVVGEHTVIFAGEGERIELTHRAESRVIFARGAIVGARYIQKKERGLYSMLDALGLEVENL